MSDCDVVIVGAGPTGLSLAAQCLRYGLSFTIIDRKDGPTEFSKALVVHARTMEIYDQIGLAQQARSEGQPLTKVAILSDGKLAAKPDFSEMGQKFTPFPYFLVLEQSKNEHLLYDYSRAHGADVQWRTELVDFHQDDRGVTADVTSADGATTQLTARYLVGCDGASSPVREQLALGFDGSTYPRLFYVADVEMTLDVPDAEINNDGSTLIGAFGKNAYVLMAPFKEPNHWRFTGNVPDFDARGQGEGVGEDIGFEVIAERTQRLVARPMAITKLNWFSKYKVHTRHVEKFGVGRVFVAGDAAHVHTPAGGQGMNTGIQDAYNLAWKLALVLRAGATPALLDTYNEERLANARHLVRSTDRFFDVIAGDSWSMQLFRRYALPGFAKLITSFEPVREIMFPSMAETAISYRDQSLSQSPHHGHFTVQPGDRMPYLLVDGSNVFDRFSAPKFHLVQFSDGQQPQEDPTTHLDPDLAAWVDSAVVPLYPRVTELFGTDTPFTVLLRPDNYIATIWPGLDITPAQQWLANIITSPSP
ncbi:MAG: FAD-dependent monooxygenase [Mycobacterium sp.]|uniref:FAD-dependent monooxygenase n=1 Tax=Mycobacterium sp. TaxID=1785 RepID=UPI003F996EBE